MWGKRTADQSISDNSDQPELRDGLQPWSSRRFLHFLFPACYPELNLP